MMLSLYKVAKEGSVISIYLVSDYKSCDDDERCAYITISSMERLLDIGDNIGGVNLSGDSRSKDRPLGWQLEWKDTDDRSE